MNRLAHGAAAAALVLSFGLHGCNPADTPDTPPAERLSEPVEEGTVAISVGGPESRRALFGDLHIHTRYSFDAYIFGTRTTPDDAYRFARGDTIDHPAGFEMSQSRPARSTVTSMLGRVTVWVIRISSFGPAKSASWVP